MMKRALAVCFLLGLLPLINNCTSQPTPTHAPPPDLSLHLLVETVGDLRHKPPGSQEYLPLSFGIALDGDDLLRAASDAQGLVVCADLSLASVPPGYHGGLPCPQAVPILKRGKGVMVAPQRGKAPSFVPYILSPRRTFILTGLPLVRWYPSDAASYTVRVWGKDLDWQTESTTTELHYPEDAPPLKPGVSYHLTVTDANGRSSDEEGTALDLSFALLPPEEVAAVQTLIAQAQGLNLNERGTRLLEAEIYAAHGLRADGIALLKELATGEDAPTIHRRLGDLYLEVGLYTEAQEAYEQALIVFRALGDRSGEAASLAGLGLAH